MLKTLELFAVAIKAASEWSWYDGVFRERDKAKKVAQDAVLQGKVSQARVYAYKSSGDPANLYTKGNGVAVLKAHEPAMAARDAAQQVKGKKAVAVKVKGKAKRKK